MNSATVSGVTTCLGDVDRSYSSPALAASECEDKSVLDMLSTIGRRVGEKTGANPPEWLPSASARAAHRAEDDQVKETHKVDSLKENASVDCTHPSVWVWHEAHAHNSIGMVIQMRRGCERRGMQQQGTRR